MIGASLFVLFFGLTPLSEEDFRSNGLPFPSPSVGVLKLFFFVADAATN
jgi:hypothetical protein